MPHKTLQQKGNDSTAADLDADANLNSIVFAELVAYGRLPHGRMC